MQDTWTAPEASLQKHNGSISTTSYVEKCDCETAEKCTWIFRFFHNVDIVI